MNFGVLKVGFPGLRLDCLLISTTDNHSARLSHTDITMPPKGAAGAKVGLSQDEFLAACFKCAKEKILVDYDKLAGLTGMSKGGAQ